MEMGIKMSECQAFQNPQQMPKKLRNYCFLLKIFESNSFDFDMKKKILIILKMPFLILSDVLDLTLFLISVNYFGNLSW